MHFQLLICSMSRCPGVVKGRVRPGSLLSVRGRGGSEDRVGGKADGLLSSSASGGGNGALDRHEIARFRTESSASVSRQASAAPLVGEGTGRLFLVWANLASVICSLSAAQRNLVCMTI